MTVELEAGSTMSVGVKPVSKLPVALIIAGSKIMSAGVKAGSMPVGMKVGSELPVETKAGSKMSAGMKAGTKVSLEMEAGSRGCCRGSRQQAVC